MTQYIVRNPHNGRHHLQTEKPADDATHWSVEELADEVLRSANSDKEGILNECLVRLGLTPNDALETLYRTALKRHNPVGAKREAAQRAEHAKAVRRLRAAERAASAMLMILAASEARATHSTALRLLAKAVQRLCSDDESSNGS